MLPNISRSKRNQTMKFGQLLEYSKMNIFFFKNPAENESGRLPPDHFLFSRKALNEVKASGLQLSFKIFRWPLTWHTIKTNCIKLL